MTNLTQIAKTMGVDFTKAVEAALKADAALSESILSDMNVAYKKQQDGMTLVEEMEKHIGELMKETLVLREKIDNEFFEAMQNFRGEMGKLRGSKLSAPNLKAIEGGGK
jgi:hypothetical protein